MTTTGTQGRGGSSRPAQRSADGTHPKDQSTEDGGLIPYFKPSDNIHLDFLDQIIRDKYPQWGDPASEDAIDPRIIDYVRGINPAGYNPHARPTPQDLIDILDAPTPGYPSKIDPHDVVGPRNGIGNRKPGPFPQGLPGMKP